MARCAQCGREHDKANTIYCSIKCRDEYEKSVRRAEFKHVPCPPGSILKAMKARYS